MTRPSRSAPAPASSRTLSSILHAALSVPIGAGLIAGWILLSRPGWFALLVLLPVALLLWRPRYWLALLLALIPIIDLTAWTGNGYFAESDALIGAALIALGLRGLHASERDEAHLRWNAGPLIVITLLWVSYIVALARGLTPLPAINAGTFVLFGGNMEAVRLARGPLLALWCLPFLTRTGLRGLAAGAVLAMLGVASAVLLERLSFTSLTDFATDYRTTGSFWEMHVGGAALDGALVLTWPITVWAAVRGRGWLRVGAGLASLLGAYAILAGFTRSTYAAAGVSLLVLLTLSLWQPSARQRRSQPVRWPIALLITTVLLAAAATFDSSGYRGLVALLCLAVCGWLAAGAAPDAPAASRGPVLVGLACGIVLAGLAAMLDALHEKMVYLQFIGIVVLAALSTQPGRPRRALGTVGAFAALAWSAIGAVRVADHWGGGEAGTLMAVAALVLAALTSVPALAGRVAWRIKRRHIVPLLVALGCTGMTIAVANSYYAGARFSTIGADLNTRINNWRQVVTLVDSPSYALLGLGAGQFPLAYRWKVIDSLFSGDVHLNSDGQTTWATLDAPRHIQGGEEVFRLTQRVRGNEVVLPARLQFRGRARTDAVIGMELCRKHLIYPAVCIGRNMTIPGDGQWHLLTWDAAADTNLDGGPWYAYRPLTFAFSPQATQAFDVTGISLIDATGTERIDNGNFAFDGWRWFSASDRQHLPWHAKNVFLHMLVENGALGVVALGLAFIVALVRLVGWPGNMHPMAAPMAASLAGFLVAGTFDSIIDAPRVAFMLFLWLGIALGLTGATAAGNANSTPSSG
ncbi:hypothetical protein ACDA63_07950 [Uliginosibacterium sp. sgz301328]|uniref:hypothetical protein n=1 Tax=Uliginosibacterium sp. sgz301328 TaxID=3243764 RepID=UPI00359E92B3